MAASLSSLPYRHEYLRHRGGATPGGAARQAAPQFGSLHTPFVREMLGVQCYQSIYHTVSSFLELK